VASPSKKAAKTNGNDTRRGDLDTGKKRGRKAK
jgi:hypothetical protein